jgi:hypothetical protein
MPQLEGRDLCSNGEESDEMLICQRASGRITLAFEIIRIIKHFQGFWQSHYLEARSI